MSGLKTSPTSATRKRFDFSYSIRWNLLLITLGATLYSFAVKSIALPHHFIPGGIFGLSALLYYSIFKSKMISRRREGGDAGVL